MTIGLAILLLLVVVVLVIAFGGPRWPSELPAANDPYASRDRSDLPVLRKVYARDGAPLAYREYPPAVVRSNPVRVVLMHGSASRGESLHALAKGLASAGYTVYVPDVRGHGASGDGKGMAAYVGQLEDDLEDFVRNARIAPPRALIGFSAGGGFALRQAADQRSALFAHYVLLAPLLGHDASTYRPDSGGWVSVGVPRVLALALLNRIGITVFNQLAVTRYALRAEWRDMLTSEYAYALWANFRPHLDYREDLRNSAPSMAVVVGALDEQFYPQRFAAEFAEAGRASVPITIVPGVGHVGLTLEPVGVQAVVDALTRLSTLDATTTD